MEIESWLPPNHTAYAVLGVDERAPDEEIRRAYRAMAMATHPDRPGGSAAAFQTIADAYSLIGSAGVRQAYDLMLTEQRINDVANTLQDLRVEVDSYVGNVARVTGEPRSQGSYTSSGPANQAHSGYYEPHRWASGSGRIARPATAANSATAADSASAAAYYYRLAWRLRLARAFAVGMLFCTWYLTRSAGLVRILAPSEQHTGLPHCIHQWLGGGVSPLFAVLFFLVGVVIELVFHVALRVELLSPSIARWSLGAALVGMVLVGEYLITLGGQECFFGIIAAAAVGSAVLSASRCGWRIHLEP